MPFDTRLASLTDAPDREARNRRAVAIWLLVLCGMTWVMVVLGGATRLTGSGLSIMEWAPLTGALPPVSEAEWRRLFALYQRIPQYELVNKGFGLEGFKAIFWLEWTHRLWGRLIGVVFLVPLAWLAWRGAIGRRLLPRLLGLFLLGGLQGAVGWFMVASGFFPESTAVSAYRLVVHLALALALYAAMLWTALQLLPPPREVAPAGARVWLACVAGLVALTIVAGGFVAGLHAGLDYNTFPLMGGQVVPEGYASLSPWLRNLTENIAAVQFDHRLLASLTLLGALAVALRYWGPARGRLRGALGALVLCVLLQYGLGIATLLLVVPVHLAVTHQAVAVAVLTAALVALHAAREERA